ncbi:hypothetical protein NP233_g3362 [Leucocoprinus birnbaumii]|uniref:Uncharacterized protein n=1 Tax=Leucocoprinus birnbaumii TaxID=56174 RepID=A0AAD5YY09_9AGAR|nr:hypothetical protein NP233_g3362 [Leucocoprinus birnbaumii]
MTLAPFTISLAHAPLILYFALILGLLIIILPSITRRDYSRRALLFLFLSFLALLTTWYYMLVYFKRSYVESALRHNVSPPNWSSRQWLQSTSLFHEAWSYVSADSKRWWWSHILCSWTAGSLTVFLLTEARRGTVRYAWAYMLLGQVVAISFAQGLFLVAVSLSPKRTRTITSQPSPALASSSILSSLTVLLTPFTVDTIYYLPNLLAMHFLLIIPLVPSFSSFHSIPILSSLRYSSLYLVLTILSLISRMPSLQPSLLSVDSIYHTLVHQHPAQSSISFDVVFTSIIFATWIILDQKTNVILGQKLLLFTLGAPLGVGVWGGVYLYIRERGFESIQSHKGDTSTEARREKRLA